jgi:hypothetical protein
MSSGGSFLAFKGHCNATLPRGLKYLFVQENMVDNLTVGGT